jgi:TolB-like protein/predicted Ser/Thr protein kinase
VTPERLRQLKELFQSAIERPPNERPSFLDEACASDPTLRRHVESLISSHEGTGSFIEPSPFLKTELSIGNQPSLTAGQRLGAFEVIRHIGHGGMGDVYLAQDTRLGRKAALKLLRAEFTTDENRLRRFQQEARAASALNHPNILTIYEIGEIDSLNFIATEYVEGETLGQHTVRQTMELGQALDVVIQVVSALAAAHKLGIVHRDIKPDNVMLRPDGIVKVLDFGLAKLTEQPNAGSGLTSKFIAIETLPGIIMGTINYMSPEQARGQLVDVRTDIFSLGVMLYQMVTGHLPFEGETASDTLSSLLSKDPQSVSQHLPETPAELNRIVMKALRKDRDERYQNAEELLKDLKRLKQGLELGSVSSSSTVLLAPPVRLRSRRKVLALGLALAIIVAVGGYLLRERFPRVPPSPAAEQVTLAVLPFRALNVPEEIGFLSIGLPDAIITRLASARQIRLRPTSAILRYEKQDVDVQEVGRALASAHVVIGTVQKVGDRLRVNVQLVRVSDGVTLWGEHYDKSRGDLLSLQDEIASQIATALSIKMSADEHARVYRPYTQNAAAYELYLQGRSHLARYTKDGTLAALKDFEGALGLDSKYALAHAGLAMASAQMRIRYASETEFQDWEERARREAQRALDLDSNLAEVHEALAAVHRNAEFNWEQTIAESDRALQLNPNLEMPHYYRAAAFYHLGLLELVEQEVREGMDINPANRAEPLRVRGTTALFDGRYAEAAAILEQAQRVSEALTTNWYLAQAYYYQGEHERAEAMLTNLHGSAQAEQRAKATLASLVATRGDKSRAQTLLREVTAGIYMDHHVAYSVGVAYAQLGDGTQALKWLARAEQTGLPCYPWYERDPLLQNMRKDNEFQRFMAELKKSWESAKARHAT